LTPDLLIIYK